MVNAPVFGPDSEALGSVAATVTTGGNTTVSVALVLVIEPTALVMRTV